MTTLSTSEVLNKAADLIEEHGWTKGQGWTDTGKGLCLEGGIAAALGIETNFAAPHDEDDYTQFAACPAYRAVKDYLGYRADLWNWNDRRAESAEDVIATLRATALIEAARERESVEV